MIDACGDRPVSSVLFFRLFELLLERRQLGEGRVWIGDLLAPRRRGACEQPAPAFLRTVAAVVAPIVAPAFPLARLTVTRRTLATLIALAADARTVSVALTVTLVIPSATVPLMARALVLPTGGCAARSTVGRRRFNRGPIGWRSIDRRIDRAHLVVAIAPPIAFAMLVLMPLAATLRPPDLDRLRLQRCRLSLSRFSLRRFSLRRFGLRRFGLSRLCLGRRKSRIGLCRIGLCRFGLCGLGFCGLRFGRRRFSRLRLS